MSYTTILLLPTVIYIKSDYVLQLKDVKRNYKVLLKMEIGCLSVITTAGTSLSSVTRQFAGAPRPKIEKSNSISFLSLWVKISPA